MDDHGNRLQQRPAMQPEVNFNEDHLHTWPCLKPIEPNAMWPRTLRLLSVVGVLFVGVYSVQSEIEVRYIPMLIHDLNSTSTESVAVGRLRSLGPLSSGPVGESLKGSGTLGRKAAARLLPALPGDRNDQIALLALVLKTDSDAEVAEAAGQALATYGTNGLKPVVSVLQGGDIVAKARASVALGRFQTEEALPVIATILRDKSSDKATCESAVEALRPFDAAAIPILIDCLSSPYESVQQVATQNLGRLGLAAKSAIPALTGSALRGNFSAVSALHAFGDEANGPLCEILRKGPPRPKRAAAIKLRLRGSRVVPKVLEVIRNGDEDTIGVALSALDGLGPAAREALPTLQMLLEKWNPTSSDFPDNPQTHHLVHLLREMGAEAITPYYHQFDQGDFRVTQRASKILGAFGKPAVPFLVGVLRRQHTRSFEDLLLYNDKQLALLALKEIGPDATEASEVLSDLLSSPDSDLAAEALASIKGNGLTSLRHTLLWGDIEAQQAAANALGQLGPPAVDILVEALRKKESDAQIVAARALITMPTTPTEAIVEAIQVWADKGRHYDADFNIATWIPEETNGAVLAHTTDIDLYIKWLRQGTAPQKISACFYLSRLGCHAKRAVSPLVDTLRARITNVPPYAADALGSIGPEAKTAVSALCECLSAKDPVLVVSAARALQGIGPDAAVATSQLVDLLKGRSEVRVAALGALAGIGTDAASATTAILAICNNAQEATAVRAAAAKALVQIGIESALEAVASHYSDPDPVIWRLSCEAIEKRGRTDKGGVDRLQRIIRRGGGHDYESYRAAVVAFGKLQIEPKRKLATLHEGFSSGWHGPALIEVIGTMGEAAKLEAERIASYTDDHNPVIAAAAVAALESIDPIGSAADIRIGISDLTRWEQKTFNFLDREHLITAWELLGPRAAGALPQLVSVLRYDKDDRLRIGAVKATASIGSLARVALPEIRIALTEGDGEIRVQAAEALGKIGPSAAVAIPDLVRALEPANFLALRISAARALGRIGPDARIAIPALQRTALEKKGVGLQRAARDALAALQRPDLEHQPK